ncbi:MAG: ATPase domain-containing protein [Kosmotogaceae bacterium]
MIDERISTGIYGMDEILDGGLIKNQAYLVRGAPGTGKTIFGLHFLTNTDEKNVFITFEETEKALKRHASALGFNLDNVDILDLTPASSTFSESESYDVFFSSEVEKNPLTEKIVTFIEEKKPERVFVDSLTSFGLITQDRFQFRKEVLSFINYIIDNDITLVCTSEIIDMSNDSDLQYMVDGVMKLSKTHDRTFVNIEKYRGSDYRKGKHTCAITSKGLKVYPRLIPDRTYRRDVSKEMFSFGIPELDKLSYGGIERGTVTVISGASGCGKTTLGTKFTCEAASKGKKALIYTFEESVSQIKLRGDSMNIPVSNLLDSDKLVIKSIEPLRYNTDEFAYIVMNDVKNYNASLVMIDSIVSYRMALEQAEVERPLVSLVRFLSSKGITCLLIHEIQEIIGNFMPSGGMSFLCDNIFFLRYIEYKGELKKVIGILKKRQGDFEKTLRLFNLTEKGIVVGKPFTELRGLLYGVPEFTED